MTDADVRAALQLATRDVHPGADLLTGVRRGGRQRVVRRRAVLAGGLAALLAGPTAGLLHRLPSRSDTPVASVLFDAATRGDLAADVGYLQLVLAEWTRHHAELSGPDSRGGEPHVVWAGSTPVGPAAVVAQRHPAADGELSGTVGFVEQTSVGPRVVSADSFTSRDASTPVPAALLGDNRDVLVVLDAGYPVSWSSAPTFRPDGRVERTFSAVAFRDGAAVLRVPAQRDRVTVALRAAFRSAVRRVDIANAAAIKARPSGQVPAMRVIERALPGAEAVWPTDPAMQAELAGWRDTALAPYRDDAGDHRPSTQPAWWIRGVTPDGRRLWVQVEASYDDPARVLAVLGRPRAQPRVIYGGMIGRREPLAVRLRLPERQGVVVAAQDAVLRYRTAGGSWQPVAGDAALLPDAATQVQVTRGAAAPVVVALP